MDHSGVPPHALSFAIRWLHVVASTVVLGGAVLVVALAAQPGHERRSALRLVARAYEWCFWGAVGILIMTGVGNLGAFGLALPGPETLWGSRLLMKLFAVGGLLVLSLVRTVAVLRMGSPRGSDSSPVGPSAIAVLYVATALGLAAVLWLATSLAHSG